VSLKGGGQNFRMKRKKALKRERRREKKFRPGFPGISRLEAIDRRRKEPGEWGFSPRKGGETSTDPLEKKGGARKHLHCQRRGRRRGKRIFYPKREGHSLESFRGGGRKSTSLRIGERTDTQSKGMRGEVSFRREGGNSMRPQRDERKKKEKKGKKANGFSYEIWGKEWGGDLSKKEEGKEEKRIQKD